MLEHIEYKELTGIEYSPDFTRQEKKDFFESEFLALKNAIDREKEESKARFLSMPTPKKVDHFDYRDGIDNTPCDPEIIRKQLSATVWEMKLFILLDSVMPKFKQVVKNPFLASFFAIPHGDPYDHKKNAGSIWWSINGDIQQTLLGEKNKANVCYGSIAKMLWLYIVHENFNYFDKPDFHKVKFNTREIVLGSNLGDFLEVLGFSNCTTNRRKLEKIIEQFCNCFFETENDKSGDIPFDVSGLRWGKHKHIERESMLGKQILRVCYDTKFNVLEKMDKKEGQYILKISESWLEQTITQGCLYNFLGRLPDVKKLSFDFDVLKAISGKSYAIDLYVLLYALDQERAGESFTISWFDLKRLNGSGIAEDKNYRKSMREGLDILQKHWLKAELATLDEDGLTVTAERAGIKTPVFP